MRRNPDDFLHSLRAMYERAEEDRLRAIARRLAERHNLRARPLAALLREIEDLRSASPRDARRPIARGQTPWKVARPRLARIERLLGEAMERLALDILADATAREALAAELPEGADLDSASAAVALLAGAAYRATARPRTVGRALAPGWHREAAQRVVAFYEAQTRAQAVPRFGPDDQPRSRCAKLLCGVLGELAGATAGECRRALRLKKAAGRAAR